MVLSLKAFRTYIVGRQPPPLIRTDHRALTWLMQYKAISDYSLLSRWLSIICEYSFTIEWRSSTKHRNADGLSRMSFPKERKLCIREDCQECIEHRSQLGKPPLKAAAKSQIQCASEREDSSDICNTDSEDEVLLAAPPISDVSEADTKIPIELEMEDQLEGFITATAKVSSNKDCNNEGGTEDTDPPELVQVSNWVEQYTSEELQRLQGLDPDLKIVIGWLKEDLARPPSKDALSIESTTVKTLAAQYNLLKLTDGVLFRIIPDKERPETVNIVQYVVPDSIREELLIKIHDHNGHWGYAKCSKLLKNKHYWPGMTSQLKDFISGCIYCGRTKGNKQRYTKLTPYPSGVFNEKIHIDIWKSPVVGKVPIPGSDNCLEFHYILGIVDSFTKLTKLVNLHTKTAEECADRLLDRWCLVYGHPVSIISDNDPSFLGAIFSQLCKATHTIHRTTTTYHPCSNGQAEICFRQVSRFMKIMISDELQDWPLMTPFCEFHLNTSANQSTKLSPLELIHGTPANIASDLMWPANPRVKVPRVKCTTGYVVWLQRQLKQVQKYARENLKGAAIRMKKYYDARYTKPPEIGEYCYRYIPPWNKLQCKYVGPGKVIKKISEIHILWQAQPDSPVIRLNLKNVKRYSSSREPANWSRTGGISPQGKAGPPEHTTEEESDQPDVQRSSSSSDDEDEDGRHDSPLIQDESNQGTRRSARQRKPVTKMNL